MHPSTKPLLPLATLRHRHPHLHVWGRETVQPAGRTLWSSRTLVVFPPGTSPRERFLLRALHVWGVVGALPALCVMAALNGSALCGILAAVALYGTGFLALRRATRRTRPSVRTLTVTTFHGGGRPRGHGDARLLAGLLDALLVSERAALTGRISAVEFELLWADVWNTLPEVPRRGRA
ncbi:DUF6611 family protein [Curtobacterium luteum]|uniref:Uncharacterized protein n=1 Tax=Curtobacterium luteum TaxID=33881 RepID=A0A175RT32_9MICO|nr:DUF6611 family protein [Curtobacterium luteum]KTR06975.1 hypothetical protein NS184_08475 [Curtobacterium luteum]